ncbi:GntR domain protein [Pseudarthrobacter chlorophenolicus A6]|uniref:GntR domain protein n=1 Tax=Pseudarthrobacter chlorophenolicus (strain ATCC 700700 / DSM 12829 / CIP 107037 / JCM 12360 / KCTC 9906 / NCIMB 13794 / A6) TaxID=452863 RepID=B8HE90_PSECP|nr:FCD domain-containing protein [Pseudarthrobacter chlorophenolicus]ACL39125.1 GntR domain protein [Pseudarthrobacter chlorophenolicus A6]SDR04048.1 DNA-binding transcriptional regulator, FadR family [Pseudarthrobacter chlorophenolicus]
MSTATVEETDDAHDGGASGAMHERVLEAVGVAVASGQLPPGSRLTLEGLQQEYRISRTVARDTMKVLESMNLVYSRRRVGIVVQEREHWNVFDPKLVRWRLASDRREVQYSSLTELRIAVEPIAAAGAARRASADERAQLLALARDLRRLGEAGDLQNFLAADIEFHQLLLRSCGNEMFRALEGMVAEVLTSRTQQGLMPFKPRNEALQAHEDVAAAVAGGDTGAAEQAMHHILDEVREAMGLR